MNKKAVILGVLLAAGGIVLARRTAGAAPELPGDGAAPEPADGAGIWLPDLSDIGPQIDYWITQNYTETESNTMPLQTQTQTANTLSPAGLDKIKAFEGFSVTAYPDHKGYSIGYGHLIKAGDGLSTASRVTQEQALQLLAGDVGWAVAAVNQAVHVGLAQAQFDALVSLCFNIGEGAFKSSTLVKRINAGDAGAAAEFDRWVNASGKVNSALVARRAQERADFESAA